MDGGATAELYCYKLESCTGEAQINRRKGNKVRSSLNLLFGDLWLGRLHMCVPLRRRLLLLLLLL